MTRRPPTSPLFPYMTLFRSERHRPERGEQRELGSDREAALDHLVHGAVAVDERRPEVERDDGLDVGQELDRPRLVDRKSTRLNSSHSQTSYAGLCLKNKLLR